MQSSELNVSPPTRQLKCLFRSHHGADTEVEFEDKPILDWNTRYRIAAGMARAIAYLLEKQFEWILHSDIKPKNILLGNDFCPKTSGFGLSKPRKKEQADVYSFMVLLLEIVSGTRNFNQQESSVESAEWYFPMRAFDKVLRDTKVVEILDHQIKDLYDSKQHVKMAERMVETTI
ncbi:hypothetical protein Ancab_018368 [Ancistrocladus abbreviatus]